MITRDSKIMLRKQLYFTLSNGTPHTFFLGLQIYSHHTQVSCNSKPQKHGLNFTSLEGLNTCGSSSSMPDEHHRTLLLIIIKMAVSYIYAAVQFTGQILKCFWTLLWSFLNFCVLIKYVFLQASKTMAKSHSNFLSKHAQELLLPIARGQGPDVPFHYKHPTEIYKNTHKNAFVYMAKIYEWINTPYRNYHNIIRVYSTCKNFIES